PPSWTVVPSLRSRTFSTISPASAGRRAVPVAPRMNYYRLSLRIPMAQSFDVKGKRVLVVGLGKSGVASALFLHERGARVTVSDAKAEEQLRNEIPKLLDLGIAVETGGHGERTFR